jgi:hypothetical protein
MGHPTTYRDLDTAELAARFAAASPFPHVVLDDLIAGDPEAIAASFPTESWDGWTTQFRDRYQAEKRTCEDLDAIPAPLRAIIAELQSPGFLEVVEAITGIEAIIPDPYLSGGGLHLSGPGGVLEPHTDFHVYPRLNLFRQVNILVYLNPTWEEEWGGCLELFADAAAETSAERVIPAFGRCVLFRTDDQSVHGFPTRIAEGHWRRSIALYYYTAVDRPGYVGDKYTYWRRHGEHTGADKARLQVHKALVAGQGFLAKAAKAARPPEPKPIETPPARHR